MSRDVDKFISGAVQTFFSSLTSHCVCTLVEKNRFLNNKNITKIYYDSLFRFKPIL